MLPSLTGVWGLSKCAILWDSKRNTAVWVLSYDAHGPMGSWQNFNTYLRSRGSSKLTRDFDDERGLLILIVIHLHLTL